MIAEFVQRWEERKGILRAAFSAKPCIGEWKELVALVVREVLEVDESSPSVPSPDPQRIHEIDDGDYQGTLVYVIGSKGYQPSDYYYLRVSYGSCSVCDTLQSVSEYSSDPPMDSQLDRYMTLALHIIQGLHAMGGDAA